MPVSDVVSLATTGVVADADALLADRDVLYSGAAGATGLGDPKDLRNLPDGDGIAACLRRCAIDRKLGGADPMSRTPRAWRTYDSTALRVHAAPALRIYVRDWITDSAAAVFERHFVSVMTEQGIGEHARPFRVTTDDGIRVSRAVLLLRDLVPENTDSVLPFVHQIVVLDSPIPSLYLTQVPETVFVSAATLHGDTLGLADALLHESLHEKMAVLRLTRRLVRPGYTDERSARVLLPWNLDQATPRWFTAGRVISAAHVYTHLAVLHATALRQGRPDETGCGSRTVRQRLATAVERAGFLLDSLELHSVRREFGPDGLLLHRELTRMLTAVRDALPASLIGTLKTWHATPQREVHT
ncbi:hypothetical protein [Streptomyces sp. HUAS TT20]|uniref:hypothetical protein n=1 Tax=Streptomyces sp. HUAS TT20 TaxID=3447509 RepID=UPI0021D81612|nr:hypothetical protein [Streptomyces sp. HUAS 15-9]UXY31064.1 hypothetical protein N8I87_33945 [Streptomyces sp. HUAS 15-9]